MTAALLVAALASLPPQAPPVGQAPPQAPPVARAEPREIQTYKGKIQFINVERESLFIRLDPSSPPSGWSFFCQKDCVFTLNGSIYTAEALILDWYRNSDGWETAEVDTIPEMYGRVRAVRITRTATPPAAKATACTCEPCPDLGRRLYDRDGSMYCLCGCGRSFPRAGTVPTLPPIRRRLYR